MPKREPKVGDVIFWATDSFPFITGNEILEFDNRYPIVDFGNDVRGTCADVVIIAILPPEAGNVALSELHAAKLRYNAAHRELLQSMAPDLVKAVPFAADVDRISRFIA